MFAWFTWGAYNTFIIGFLPILFGLNFIINTKVTFDDSIINKLSIILIIILQLYIVREFKITALILSIFRIINISLLILLNDKFKKEIFYFISNSLLIILGISSFFWILFLLGINLPNGSISYEYGPYINYYFFILYDEQSFFSIIPRFSSIFLEPGYLGMLTAFLIISNKFNFEKLSVKILLVATLFSFSLAAFLVIIITYFLYLLTHSNKSFLYLIIIVCLIFGLYIVSVNLNSGENAVYNYLFKRLEFNNGEISGYNRFSSDLDNYYKEFLKSRSIYFGIGEVEFRKLSWDGGNAGYKVFIIQYGIIGTLLVFLFYFLMLMKSYSKIASLLFLAYILIFLQASYPLIESELIIFITAISILKKKENLQYKQYNGK